MKDGLHCPADRKAAHVTMRAIRMGAHIPIRDSRPKTTTPSPGGDQSRNFALAYPLCSFSATPAGAEANDLGISLKPFFRRDGELRILRRLPRRVLASCQLGRSRNWHCVRVPNWRIWQCVLSLPQI